MPTVTSETEIFDRLLTSLRAAAESCQYLAWDPRRGFRYEQFRKDVKLVEGCCRQICHWREDTRWLVLGRMMAFAHARCGHWLRNSPTPQMRKIAQPEFKRLSEKLTQMVSDVDRMRTMATGKRGAILPVDKPLDRESGRPVQVPAGFTERASGLIVPA